VHLKDSRMRRGQLQRQFKLLLSPGTAHRANEGVMAGLGADEKGNEISTNRRKPREGGGPGYSCHTRNIKRENGGKGDPICVQIYWKKRPLIKRTGTRKEEKELV